MLNIQYIVDRARKPSPWSSTVSFPWNQPDFSRRILLEHLNQDHDMASPQTEKIDKHVQFIHEELLSSQPTRILDLGCGPGLYTSRLAQLGHTCIGVDFSPASLEYAKDQAVEQSLDCTYIQGDLREVPFPGNLGLIMMLHGEMNAFSKNDMQKILMKINAALETNGQLLLPSSTIDGIRPKQSVERTWSTYESGLFSDSPYLELDENMWDPETKTLVERYFIVDGITGEVSEYSSSMQAYTKAEYRSLLNSCGFVGIKFLPPLFGMENHLFCAITLTGRKK
ncbi:MAG: class I SAM-dependent methyltransferase [Chloroflexi bacterium]|nr:class I SAM-dependent methyltransferase [Chloroflexota bacterium]